MKKHQMENQHAGIWIDQNEAMIVTWIDGRSVVELVRSNAESQSLDSDESRTGGREGEELF